MAQPLAPWDLQVSTLARTIFTPDVTAPSIPVNLVASGFSQSTIRLVWSASSDSQSGIGSYAIYRSATSGGSYTFLSSSLLPQFDDTTVAGSQTWFYKVLAIDGAGNPSALSSSASATTPDQTAPGVPGTPTLVSATTTSITLTWTASTDTGGSGLKGYDVERNGQIIAQDVATISYADTGLISSTSYSYRVRAKDNAGNLGNYSPSQSLSTSGAAGAVAWNGASTPTQSPQQNVAYDLNLASLTTGAAGARVVSGALLSGHSLSALHVIGTTASAPGTTTSPTIRIFDAEQLANEVDFEARSASAGILRAVRFTSLADVQANTLQDAQANHVVFEPNIRRSGVGSARFNILNADSTSSGGIRLYISPAQTLFGNNSEYYVQWSQYLPAAFCNGLFPGTPGIGDGIHSNGFKQLICSHFSASNQNNEVVMENSFQMGCPLAYYQDGSSFVQFSQAWSSACNSSDFRFQNAIDNGGAVTNCPTAWARWGPMYSMPTYTGTPHAQNGGAKYVPDVYMTFMVRNKIGTLGTASSTYESWCAVSGQAPKKMHSYIGNIKLGTANGGHNAIWLLPYQTGKSPGVGYDTFTCYDEVLTGTQPIPFPGGFTVTPG